VKKQLLTLIGLLLAGVLMYGCGDTGMQTPTSSSTVGDVGSYQQSVEPSTPAEPVAPSKDELHGFEITSDGTKAYSSITNELSRVETFALACYSGNMNNLDEQELVGSPTVVKLEPREEHNFEAPLACGVLNQCDNVFNIRVVSKKPAHHSKTLNAKIIMGDPCPTPVGCTKPKEKPQCEFGPAIYNAGNCTYSCPGCVMPEKPECPYGDAIVDGCGWVCPECVLSTPPECPFGPAIPDRESCKWDCPECVVEWLEQDPIRENESEYDVCVPIVAATHIPDEPPTVDCLGQKSRTVDIVVYEVNSCTQETREKSRETITETTECITQCEQPLCHTQNAQYCMWHNGEWKNCKNHRYIFSQKVWQCQNVPPGTPGHYPNHFGANSHDDFWGVCSTQKCYNIVN